MIECPLAPSVFLQRVSLWLTGLDSLLVWKETFSQSETEGLNLDFPNII